MIPTFTFTFWPWIVKFHSSSKPAALAKQDWHYFVFLFYSPLHTPKSGACVSGSSWKWGDWGVDTHHSSIIFLPLQCPLQSCRLILTSTSIYEPTLSDTQDGTQIESGSGSDPRIPSWVCTTVDNSCQLSITWTVLHDSSDPRIVQMTIQFPTATDVSGCWVVLSNTSLLGLIACQNFHDFADSQLVLSCWLSFSPRSRWRAYLCCNCLQTGPTHPSLDLDLEPQLLSTTFSTASPRFSYL